MYLSGIRPTGRLHLGNYLGCIKPFIDLGCDGRFFVADLHCQNDSCDTLNTVNTLYNLGITAETQSNHAQYILAIAHELSFIASTGQLNRMTQFKDKSKTEHCTLNLFAYPVLMAADIFYFNQPKVIIGEDQKQHIEFARDLSDKTDYPKPEPVFSSAPRVMNLQDSSEKMSKSSDKQKGVIYLDDSKDIIAMKIKKAKTSHELNDNTPEMINLKTIYAALGGIESHTNTKGFKEDLTQLIITIRG